MKFRLKIMLCMIWLLSLAFGIGGSFMIWGSFSSALAQEKQTAEDSYRFLVRTIEMVNSINTLPNTSDIAGVLKQMDGMGITNFSAIRLLSGGVLEYTSGNTELSSDYTESGIAIETAPDGARYYKLSGTVGTEADTLAFIAFYDISSVFAMRDGQFKTYAAVFAVTIAVCAVLSYFISLWLTKPLDKLTKATKKLAEGELSYRADIRTGDEIGQLSESFDAMAQKLEENVEQLQDAMRRQEEFMGSFAHEMKTPMTSIIGYADFIRSGSLDEEEQMNAANYIFSEGKRLESLSAKLLDIIVMNNRKIELRSVSPAQLISHLVEYLKPIYSQEGIVLQYKCEEGECLLEPDLVKSLVSNLIDNSRKSFTDGGNIYLRSRMLPDGCEIRVLDNGPGIPPEAIDHLTEAFYRVDKSRSRMQGGAGLGLALCSDIAKLHNGTLRIESRVGNGTEVTAELHGGRI